MKKRIIALLACLVLALALTACGSSETETLEDKYSQETVQEQISEMTSQYSDVYSDIQISLSGNRITYAFTFAQQVQVTQEDVDKAFEGDSSVNDLFDQISEESGIPADKIEIEYVYKNPDGTVLADSILTKQE